MAKTATVPGPNKIDPTHTATLRRKFKAEVNRHFNRLRAEVFQLVVVEDAFGLKERLPMVPLSNSLLINVFCPTGKGGGVDAKCSTGGKSGARRAGEAVGKAGRKVGSIIKKANDAVKGIKSKVGGALTKFVDKVPGGKTVREKLASLQSKMEQRYGKNTMRLIVAGSNVVSWGAMLAGGVYVPSSAAMAVGATLAEAHLQGRRLIRAVTGRGAQAAPATNAEEVNLTPKQIMAKARLLYEALLDEHRAATGPAGNMAPNQPRVPQGSPKGGEWTKGGGTPQPGSLEHYRAIMSAAGRMYPNDPASASAMVRKMGYPNMSEEHYGRTVASMGATPPAPANPVAPVVKTSTVAEHVSRLADRDRYNHVEMTALHDSLGKPDVKQMHAAVTELWRAGAVTLSELEGRFGVSERERALALVVPSSRSHGLGSMMGIVSVADRALLSRYAAGAVTNSSGAVSHPPTVNDRWRFNTDAERVRAFRLWLEGRIQEHVRGLDEEEVWRQFIEDGYRRGAGRAFDDVRRARRQDPSGVLAGEIDSASFYAGTREEFLRSSFGQPVGVERLQLLVSRTLDELDNVTTDMATRMMRVLADGLVTGASPLDVARMLSDQLDVSRSRAEVIARTELIRAHSEGQLTSLEAMGVAEVGVAVEWTVTKGACALCAPLSKVVLKVEEARGMIPRHPNCRCAWIPANVGEGPEPGRKTGKAAIDRAVLRSADLGGDGFGTAVPVSRRRPTTNVFTPALLALDRFLITLAKSKGGPNCGTGTGGFKPGNVCAVTKAGGGVAGGLGVGGPHELLTKSDRAKAAHVMVDRPIQRYAEEYNEPRLAKALGGRSLPDTEPCDVVVDRRRQGIEIKTMVLGKDDKLTMNSYSQVRKVMWERGEAGRTFHTIVSDDRKVYNGKGAGQHDESQRVYYYRRGVAGSARIATMYQCKSEAELRTLMSLPESKLPRGAGRTDGRITAGKWTHFTDDRGKGYRDEISGREVRAKK